MLPKQFVSFMNCGLEFFTQENGYSNLIKQGIQFLIFKNEVTFFKGKKT
jgi:hypothetical protein